MALLFIILIPGYGKEPILEYLFDETGTYAESTGSDNTQLLLKKKDGTVIPADLHTEGGLGVSGFSYDRAFDNYSWCEPFQAGIAEQEALNTTINELKSLTIQGWFWMEKTQGSYKQPPEGTKPNTATIIKGPFMLDMTNDATEVGLTFRVGATKATSALSYGITKEWVFFAFTFDKTKIENNVSFYIGTKTQPVTLVSVNNLDVNFRTDLLFTVGGQSVAGSGMFYGLLDNIRLYGSNTDASGILTHEELEQVRTSDITLVPDSNNSTIEVSPRINTTDKSINVTVNVKDSFGTNISGQTVTLNKTSGDIDFEPMNAITDLNGTAVFSIISPISGTLTFEAIMGEYILGTSSIQFINSTGLNRIPIWQYLFDETGTYAESTGSDNTQLLLKKKDGTVIPADLHTEGGLGVSGFSYDRAFDNYSWCEPFQAGIAEQEALNTTINELKSLTIQGWFWMEKTQGSYKQPPEGTKPNTATIIKGPFMLDMTNDATEVGLTFRVGATKATSALSYGITKEWVFFAFTFDKTKIENNVSFYIGTKTQPVTLVSVNNLDVNFRTDLLFTVGGQSVAGTGMFYGLLDNIRLYGSNTDASGMLTHEELEQVRTSDILLLPDPFVSKVEADSTVCIADGKDVVSITVHVINEAGNNFSGATVTLAGDNNLESISKVTGPDGKAVFAINSKKSGVVNFTASVIPGNNFDPIALQDKVTVEFIQAVNSTESDIIGEVEPVSADGESEYMIKVKLRDYDKQTIDGRNVKLTSDSTDFAIVESEKVTGNEGEDSGEASFSIKANESLDSISGNVIATVAPDQEGGESITFELPIEFVGRLLIDTDNEEEYSKMLEPQRILAPGLPEDKIAENHIPNDGVSAMEVAVKLVDNNGVVSGRLVQIFEEEPQLELGDIQPTEVRTDPNGVARFQVRTTKELSGALSTNIKIKVLNDKANWVIPIQFIPDNFGLWVTGTIPEPNTEEAEVDDPFIIEFNNPIKLVENVTKIILTPDPSSPGNTETIIDIYEGPLNNNWIVDGHSLEWKHPRLATNIFYTVELEGIQDLDNNPLFPYTWRFKGTDTTPPEILIVDGKLAVQPTPWSVQVETDSELRIQFNEPLVTDETGFPIGLNISLQPTGYAKFYIYNSEDCEAIFLFEDLLADTTYTITISGARDFADLEMIPETWSFSTIGQSGYLPKVINTEIEKDIFGDTKIDTSIYIYFNKPLKENPVPEIIITKVEEPTIRIIGTTNFVSNVDSNAALLFVPDQEFSYDTHYRIGLTNASDKDGNTLEEWSMEFLTEVHSSETQDVSEGVENYVLKIMRSIEDEVSIGISIPSGTLRTGTKIQVRDIHKCEKEELAGKVFYEGVMATSALYELVTYDQGEPFTGKIGNEVTIKIPYKDNGSGFVLDLLNNLVPERSLKAFWWNSLTQSWFPLNSSVNINEKTVTCYTDNIGIIGLLGDSGQVEEYLSEVRLTANPIIPDSDGFRSETMFKFRLARDSFVTLKLFDRNGRLVATLLDEEFYQSGYNGFSWNGYINGKKLRPGIYFYRLSVKDVQQDKNNESAKGILGIY